MKKLRLPTFVTHRILVSLAVVIVPLAIVAFAAVHFHTVFRRQSIVGLIACPVLIVHDLSIGNPHPIAIDLFESNPVVRTWVSTFHKFLKKMCYIFIINHYNVSVICSTQLPWRSPAHWRVIYVIRPSFNTDCNVWKWKVQVKSVSPVYIILQGWWM